MTPQSNTQTRASASDLLSREDAQSEPASRAIRTLCFIHPQQEPLDHAVFAFHNLHAAGIVQVDGMEMFVPEQTVKGIPQAEQRNLQR